MTTHGYARRGKVTREFAAWAAAKKRCFNPENREYKWYGARGITMCDAWINDFPAFLTHVGKRPSAQHSLDRVDNDKGYVPGNVRWATKAQQTANRRWYGKLTPAQQLEIVNSPKKGRELAAQYAISIGYVSTLRARKRK